MLHFLTYIQFEHYKDDNKKKKETKELIKLEILQIAGTVETASEIQVINSDEGLAAKNVVIIIYFYASIMHILNAFIDPLCSKLY